MKDVPVGEREKRDIDAQVTRILRDLGNPDPPLNLGEVRKLLSLDLQYYNSTDAGFIGEIEHRLRLLARKTLPDLGKHLLNALTKSRLCAFWVPETSRILLDADLPKAKHRWTEGHEISHSFIAWHKHYLLGDNAQTLDPECHAVIEAEANFGSGRLLFLQQRFALEARQSEFSFDSIRALSKRYENSIASTFWRFVEERDPTHAVVGLVSIHPRHPDIGKHDGPESWRYFIRSPAFRTQFSNVTPEDVYGVLSRQASWQKGGPVLAAEHVMADAAGKKWVFHMEGFSTRHAVLTYGVLRRPHGLVVPV